MKHKRRALFNSLISLLLCFSMLVGTTFAWFTDGVSSGYNTIAAGVLDVELEYRDAQGNWQKVNEATQVLDPNALWEPGYTEVAYLRITNAGSVALKYALGIRTVSETGSVNAEGKPFLLSDHIQFGVVESQTEQAAFATRTDARNALTQSQPMSQGLTAYDTLLPEENLDVRYATLVVYMPEDVGNAANYATGQTPPKVQLGLELVATQADYESDAFGTGYDAASDIPGFSFPNSLFGGSVSAGVTADAENKVSENVTIPGSNMNAVVPTGVLLDAETDMLTLAVSPVAASEANIALGENEEALSLDVHIQGVAAGNTQPMEITLKGAAAKGLNNGNLKLYHVETDAEGNKTTVEMTRVETFDAHNQFKYDPNTGDVTLYMATFSEVAMVADTENAWEGKFDYTWYDASKTELTIVNADQLAAFGAIVGGMKKVTVGEDGTYTYSDEVIEDSFKDKKIKLIADINLADDEKHNVEGKIFYPIGYYNSTGTYEKTSGGSVTSSVSSFEGTFDGKGHTISNFYQNTWEMFGDYNNGYSGTPNHYKDAMGLFGYVYGGTVQNLTVDHFSSDGEFTPTGVIAAYADGNAIFENIAITNCNPRVYNTGNGGIIGIAGDTSAEDDDHITLKNITVDNSNKISALWGSWDVACGGLVGMYRGNVDGNGNHTGDTISFKNCHVAAQIDVNNDVCANYQYYAYRYAGMIIGSVRHNTTNKDGKTIPDMQGISASGCTVNYGTWNDYYYCEFEKNTMASYSEDYQFSRMSHTDYEYTEYNGNSIIDTDEERKSMKCNHPHTDEEDKRAVYLPFHQLFTGYSWGVSSIGLKEYSGIVTDLGITEGDQNESVKKFETKFTGNFLYRIGNKNEIKISSLFSAIDESKINDPGVYVRIDKLYEEADVKCTFVPAGESKKWTEGTLKFEGTGVVDIVIQDYDYCIPTVLKLEVIDAYNAATYNDIRNAQSYDVVLVEKIAPTSLTVSNGHTFCGNGFEVVFNGDGSYSSAAVSYGFITLKNGSTLDNTRVICKVFPKSYMFTNEMTKGSDGRYPYGYSAIIMSDNSVVSNCYVYGARNNIFVSTGDALISNTITECGSLSNIQVLSASSSTVTLDDVTTIQYQTTSDFDTNAKVLGFGVVVGLPDSTSNATIKLTGSFTQHNWVTAANTNVDNTYTKSAVEGALKVSKYQHTNDDGETTVNTGIAYMNSLSRTIVDERTNKTVKYEGNEVSISGYTGYVYSIVEKSGNPDAELGQGQFGNSDVLPSISYNKTQGDSVRFVKSFEQNTNRWINTLTLDLDVLKSYEFRFEDLVVSKNGVVLNYEVKSADGSVVNKDTSITFNQMQNVEYTLVVEDNQIYKPNGELTGETIKKELVFIIHATMTSIEPPKFAGLGTGSAIMTHEKSNFSDNWRPAYRALENVYVTYWSSTNGTTTVDLSSLNTKGTISGNTWTYTCNDYTLTIVGGQVHTDGSKISPKVAGGELFFWSADKAFGTGTTSRDIKLTYTFADKNASTTEELSKSVALDTNNYYKKSDFAKGTLTKGKESTCVTPDTLVTLADGTQKRIDEVTYSDELLVWDFYNGCYATTKASVVYNHGLNEYTIINLKFNDGTAIKFVEEHEIFAAEMNSFVHITADNVTEYVGHKFVKAEGNTYTTVELVDFEITVEETEAYTILTAVHFNAILENMFTLTPDPTDKCEMYFRRYDVGTDMKFDEAKMQADIEKYGLYTYEDFAAYATYDQFVAFDGGYLKILVGKGFITFEDILNALTTYA